MLCIGKVLGEYVDCKFADGRVPGNHASDADLYISRYLAHHMFRAPPPAETGLRRQEREAEEHAERVTAAQLAEERDDGWAEPD